jgi:hypothetical protein
LVAFGDLGEGEASGHGGRVNFDTETFYASTFGSLLRVVLKTKEPA